MCASCGKGFSRSDLRRRHEAVHIRTGVASVTKGSHKKRPRIKDAQTEESPSQLASEQNAISGQHECAANASSHEGPSSRISEHISFVPDNIDLGLHIPPPSGSDQPSYVQQQTMPVLTPEDEWRHVSQLPFDFMSTLMPDYGDNGSMDNWFTIEFYLALQETGAWYEMQNNSSSAPPGFLPVDIDNSEDEADTRGRVSRISSPPNEASEEDKWPFQWNPKSHPVKSANPISMSKQLFNEHDPTFDLTEDTYQRLVNHLNPAERHSQTSLFTIPSLPVINILIGLFFKHHLPQKPVIHLPTFQINETSHPPELIAAMVIIGSIYSLQRHTRRFAIVFLDVVRLSLLSSSENDNTLIRDPLFIYASLLVCYVGLWCGNKRAFELAEATRGAVVSKEPSGSNCYPFQFCLRIK